MVIRASGATDRKLNLLGMRWVHRRMQIYHFKKTNVSLYPSSHGYTGSVLDRTP